MTIDLPPLALMQGTGNRFALVDRAALGGHDPARVVHELMAGDHSRRVDGLLVLDEGDRASDLAMTIINADGSSADMCGNGLRCATFEAFRRGIGVGRTIHVRVGNHRLPARVVSAHGDEAVVWTGMPAARVESGYDRGLIRVHLGNRHGIVLQGSLPTETEWARQVEQLHGVGLGAYNLHVACIVDPSTIRLRSWERGVGATPACASGATATVAALASRGLVRPVVNVNQVGGVLRVRWRGPRQGLMNIGPAAFISSTTPRTAVLMEAT